MEKQLSNYINKVYDERNKFIIWGVTGLTGAGCTTISKKLTKEKFDDLCAPKPNYNSNNKEDRSYSIVYNYAKEKWEKFIYISFSTSICSYVLEYPFERFIEFVKQTVSSCSTEAFNTLKEVYDKLHDIRMEIKEKIKNNEDALGQDDIYDFYFNLLPSFHENIKDIMKNHSEDYILLWQKLGNNIRKSGNPFDDNNDYDCLFRLAEMVNTQIKVLRKRSKENKKAVHVVIDAFRNPFEITFFKERYASFFLISISVEDIIRQKRLSKIGLTTEQINTILTNEDDKKDEGYFISQNISRCNELADLYIHNNGVTDTDLSNVMSLLLRYYSLIIHPGLVAPTSIERCMQIAYNAKVNSGCVSRQVGAVITNKDLSILSVGWNDTPRGQVPCNLRSITNLINCNDQKSFSKFELNNEEYRNYVRNKSANILTVDKHIPFCFKDTYIGLTENENQVYTRSLHAEENAFLQLIKNGVRLDRGGFLFSTASPCDLCSKKAYQMGIDIIYSIDPYPGIAQDQVLKCGDYMPKLLFFEGAIGRAYTSFYQNSIPLKDEMTMFYDLKYKDIKRNKK